MKYVCEVCGWVGIAPGTKWEEVDEEFLCPLCALGKDVFVAE